MAAPETDVHRTFAVVRPYPARIRQRVFEVLGSLGYEENDSLDAGTPDGEAAAWALRVSASLLLLPYHKHKDREGRWVNGLGVAQRLGPEFAAKGTPILMPVDEFTFASSFAREYNALTAECSEVATRLVVMREQLIGSQRIASLLESAAGDGLCAAERAEMISAASPAELV